MARIGGLLLATLFAVYLAPALCADEWEEHLTQGLDDACAEDEMCVNMMQKRVARHHAPPEGAAAAASAPEGTDSMEQASEKTESIGPAAGVNMSDPAAIADMHDMMTAANSLEAQAGVDGGVVGDLDVLFKQSAGWSQGGDKMWGSGTGVESINIGNVGYYNAGMAAALAHCGDAGCALLTNPAGHRTINQFHIHFIHYASYGGNLKNKLASMTCNSPGWHSGGLPCGGKAIFVSGFPGVFSTAMSGGSIIAASVIVWPQSCGGRGTIVQLAFACSIEHQIRGDYNPALR